MQRVIDYLNHRLNLPELGYYLEYIKSLALREMMELIRGYNERVEFANLTDEQSNIRPDGGNLVLRKATDVDFKRVVLVVEMKRQGANDLRAAEGKGKQATGNAIERLGKNLIGIRSTGFLFSRRRAIHPSRCSFERRSGAKANCSRS